MTYLLTAPLHQMLLLFRLLDNLFAHLALSCVPETSDNVGTSLVPRNDLFAVDTLDIVLAVLVLSRRLACVIIDTLPSSLISGNKLLLAAKDLWISLCFDVKNLDIV